MNNRFYFLLLFLLSGCMVGPNYHRPALDIPCHWKTPVVMTQGYSNKIWWEQFGDPVLNELIDIALYENQNLALATARVNEFLGLYRVTRSELFPRVDGEFVPGREYVSEAFTPVPAGIKNPSSIYQAFLSASWEIDLWGKLRRATESAYAELLATEEARYGVIQTVVSAVASTYIDLLRLDRQLEIAKETAETRRKTLDLFQKRFAAGVISKIDLSQIESQYQEALASIPEFEREIGRLEHALSVLIGHPPTSIPRGSTLEDLTMPFVPQGLPSDLLTQRPDIREAEELLIAANARIGVARAAYFPTVSITGEYGRLSREFSDLFTGKAKTWNYFIPVSVPIFNAGQIAGEVAASEAIRSQAVANYRQTILTAFSEVEDALISLQKLRERVETQKKQLDSLETYARLANLRYDEGYASYLEVLDAERSLFNVQLDYSETYGDYYRSMIALYRALGGGWILAADPCRSCCN